MFTKNFYPTPSNVIEQMMQGETILNKIFLEPSAGKGDIVDYLNQNGASYVLGCELNPDLKVIASTKCKMLCDDFLALESHQISHIDHIVMNPPFESAEAHILHAYEIAPAGCKITALCNWTSIDNTYTTKRQQLRSLIDSYGQEPENLGDCFSDAERKTGVIVALVKLQKPGENYNAEFEGFFLDEEPEESNGAAGIMSYNVVRDLVNRYVGAVKIFDEHLQAGIKMNALTNDYFKTEAMFTCTENGAPVQRNNFKKELQKSGWFFIFNKMNMKKHMTKGLKEDINKFVEQQSQIPFTMRNIYHMLDMVVQTSGQRMDKGLLEVFDRITEHHHENRHSVKGWKTNSHYLVCKKFILPYQINPAKEYGYTSDNYNSLKNSYDGIMCDLEKALCYITGINYDSIKTLSASINRNTYGEWYECDFFKYKGYKNGNMHFEFKDAEIWAKFNQRIAKLKGYPLFEGKAQTKYQDRQTGRTSATTKPTPKTTPKVLFEFKVA